MSSCQPSKQKLVSGQVRLLHRKTLPPPKKNKRKKRFDWIKGNMTSPASSCPIAIRSEQCSRVESQENELKTYCRQMMEVIKDNVIKSLSKN